MIVAQLRRFCVQERRDGVNCAEENRDATVSATR